MKQMAQLKEKQPQREEVKNCLAMTKRPQQVQMKTRSQNSKNGYLLLGQLRAGV
jgi:hypothetical protein